MFVVNLMFAESFSIAVIGGLIGIGGSAVIILLFQDFIASSLKIPFIIPSLLAILVNGITALILCAVIGGIASLYPAIQISRSDSYETIRKGES
jgi:putative ABC transport system permease protein